MAVGPHPHAEPARASRMWSWLLVVCVATSLGIGAAKLFVQRGDLPEWARLPTNNYEGFVAIDSYAHRAQFVRDWWLGDADAATRLVASLRDDLHPTSVLVPAVTGTLAATGVPVLWAFAFVVVACFLLTLWLTARLARALLPAGAPAAAVLVAPIVVAAHCLTGRTVVQFHVDWPVALFTTATLGVAVALQRAPTWWQLPQLVGLGLAGVFTKSSYLPVLLVPLFAAVLGARPLRARAVAIALLAAAVAYGVAFAFARGLGLPGLTGRDIPELLAERPSPWPSLRFALEMGLLLQWLPVGLWRAWQGGGARRLLPLGAGVLLACLWWFRFPTIPRLYLPVVPILAVAAATGGAWLRPRLLAGWALLNLGSAAVAVWLG